MGGAIGGVAAAAIVAALAIGGVVVLKRRQNKKYVKPLLICRNHVYVIVIAFIICHKVILVHAIAIYSVAGYSLNIAIEKACTKLLLTRMTHALHLLPPSTHFFVPPSLAIVVHKQLEECRSLWGGTADCIHLPTHL